MSQFRDRRSVASGAKQDEPAKARGERMSEYFAEERLHRSVTRGELFSLLAIVGREHDRLKHTPWWKRLWWRAMAARHNVPVTKGGEAPLTQVMQATQQAAEQASKGKVES